MKKNPTLTKEFGMGHLIGLICGVIGGSIITHAHLTVRWESNAIKNGVGYYEVPTNNESFVIFPKFKWRTQTNTLESVQAPNN